MFNNYILKIVLTIFTLNLIAFNSNAQSIESSISKGLKNSNSLSASSLEWASLREKLNQSSAGKEITGTLSGSFSETYPSSDGE